MLSPAAEELRVEGGGLPPIGGENYVAEAVVDITDCEKVLCLIE